jgi:hypothetical protein
MSACCKSTNCGNSRNLTRRVRELLAWLFPSAMLALVPKCPACLAAYVALWTGLGLSLTTATFLRWAMLLICISSLLFLTFTRLRRNRIALR